MDYAALFAALPTPYLVLTPDLVIAEANDAYLAAVGRTREDLVGRPVFEAFPPRPDALDDSGVSRVQVSFERARDTGRPDTMPIQKYDIPDTGTGEFVERFWSLISVPVLDEQGRTVLVVQRAEDVTDYIRERERGAAERERGEAWRRKVEEIETHLFARGQELSAAVRAREIASRRIASLAEVAVQLSTAQTVEDLATVIVERGLVALGADGGAVAVRVGDVLQLAITASLGVRTQVDYAELPLDGPLPVSVAAATGERILLPDAEALLAWGPGTPEVLEATSCQAWACLPLRSEDRLLGSLSVGWREPRTFPPEELEVLEALGAQCAQGLERIQTRSAERSAAAATRRMSETLQRSLLTEPPQPPQLQIAVRYRPAVRDAQIGGDWYDAFVTSDGSTSVVVGDVAGHDRDAAAAMGQIRNLLRGIAYTIGKPPAAVLSALDRALRDLAVDSLATAVLARIEGDGPRRVLRWSNAGHPPPLLVQPDGAVHVLRTPADLLLGLDADTVRRDHQRDIEPGATVLIYTDGLVERRHTDLDEGVHQLAEVVQELAGEELEALCDALLERLGSPAEDDIALLALRVHPAPAPEPA
ncbi:MAG: SpoIIE family protein phosphatase [Mycobacteriales bacterium]